MPERRIVEPARAQIDLHVVLAGQPPEQRRQRNGVVTDHPVDPCPVLPHVDLLPTHGRCRTVVSDQIARRHRLLLVLRLETQRPFQQRSRHGGIFGIGRDVELRAENGERTTARFDTERQCRMARHLEIGFAERETSREVSLKLDP